MAMNSTLPPDDDHMESCSHIKWKRPDFLVQDENAMDAFSVRDHFNRSSKPLGDVTNIGNDIFSSIDIRKIAFEGKSKAPECIGKKERLAALKTFKRKPSSPALDLEPQIKTLHLDSSSNMIPNEIPEFDPINKDYNSSLLHKKYGIDHLDLFQNVKDDESQEIISIALTSPIGGLNSRYKQNITVTDPRINCKLVKVEKNSSTWNTIIESVEDEVKVLSRPCRQACSPAEQYSITASNQYKSECLIQKYFCKQADQESFLKSIHMDSIFRKVRNSSPDKNVSMLEYVNKAHYHDLSMEKLECNQLYHFIPQRHGRKDVLEISGTILGGFINDIFELANRIYISLEVTHHAVDLIYMYLSRVKSVPVMDLKCITLAAIWVAAKLGMREQQCIILAAICSFSDLNQNQIRKAESRLLTVIDFNILKPNVMSFRNRFLIIEQPTSTVSLISQFVLDMTLHCYTVMLLPASKRAAAAVWLARLIEKFEDISFNDDVSSDSKVLRKRMDSVWPEHFHKLTGYSHCDIAQLAIQMHIVVLAFLSRGQQKNPLVAACYNKYSSDVYKNLTGSYEKFTSRIIYYASDLYCRINGLVLSSWLSRGDFETLCPTSYESRSMWRRISSDTCLELVGDNGCNSCPELTRRPIVNKFGNKPAIKDCSLSKLDSGYSTCSWSNDFSNMKNRFL